MKTQLKHIISSFIGLIILQSSFAQDTILLDGKAVYYSDSDSIGILKDYAKDINYRIDYSKELIQYDSDSAKLEYCFYYDNKRYCRDDKIYEFRLIGDSTIEIICNHYTEKWKYSKISDSLYRLSQHYNNFTEYGYSKSLIPLEKMGDFYTIENNGDTIWKTKYTDYIIPEIKLVQHIEYDSVYFISEEMPVYNYGLSELNTDLVKNMKLYTPFMESEGICTRYVVNFIIDKNGQIKNIRFLRTCGNGFIEKSILVALKELKDFKPGKFNGKAVNIEMNFPIMLHIQ